MYALINNNAIVIYPYSLSQLHQDNPQTSFPADMPDERLADWSVYPVVKTNPPNYDSLLQNLIEDTPIKINDVWTQAWKITSASQEEIDLRKQEIKKQISQKVQQRLDNFAQTRQYDNILSACSYLMDPNVKFAQEAQYCINARSDTWLKVYQIFEEEKSGIRDMPQSYSEIESELPVLEWPIN